MTAQPKPLPCPRCGHGVLVRSFALQSGIGWFVGCLCGWGDGPHSTPEQAAKSWNTRIKAKKRKGTR
jgi:hypothetical protein